MSALRIWGSEAHAEPGRWSRVDRLWERWQEAAQTALAEGRAQDAARAWRRAWALGALAMAKDDPRRATALANLAFAARLRGDEARAARLYAMARARWAGVGDWIAKARFAPRARSSLFHMRMEMRHADQFRANFEGRLRRFAAETGEALAALERGETPSVRLAERWRGEKPAIPDDARRVLAAALLIAK